MFDTNANDAAADNEEYRQLLIWAQDNKYIQLITTHIQRDQIEAIPDVQRKAEVENIHVSATQVTTYGMIWNLSRWNEARFANEGEVDKFLGSKIRNNRNLTDALIGLTALKDGNILITDDKSLGKRCQTQGVQIMRSKQFKDHLETLKKAHCHKISQKST